MGFFQALIDLGTTLRCNYPPCHFWVVLSNLAQTGGLFLFVNMTSFDGMTCTDDACLLEPSDYELLTHTTTIAYSGSHIGRVSDLTQSIQRGEFGLVTPVPPLTLAKIIDGARRSPELSRARKALLPAA